MRNCSRTNSQTTANYAVEHKLRNHTEAQSKKRDPHTVNLVKQYNELCEKIANLIEHGRAPAGVIAPASIPLKGLFDMNVDSEIWFEHGLGDDDDVPRWMKEEDIRKGIIALIDLDRCAEEESRILSERQAMQEWFAEEWDLHCQAIRNAGIAQNQISHRPQLIWPLIKTEGRTGLSCSIYKIG